MKGPISNVYIRAWVVWVFCVRITLPGHLQMRDCVARSQSMRLALLAANSTCIFHERMPVMWTPRYWYEVTLISDVVFGMYTTGLGSFEWRELRMHFHLGTLSFSCQWEHHEELLSRSFLKHCIFRIVSDSSANNTVMCQQFDGRLNFSGEVVNIDKKQQWPQTRVLWYTDGNRGKSGAAAIGKHILWTIERKHLTQLMLGLTLNLLSLQKSNSCETGSKGLEKSWTMPSIVRPEARARNKSLVKDKSCLSQEKIFLKSCWQEVKKWIIFRKLGQIWVYVPLV